jgi:hypothetical protein
VWWAGKASPSQSKSFTFSKTNKHNVTFQKRPKDEKKAKRQEKSREGRPM